MVSQPELNVLAFWDDPGYGTKTPLIGSNGPLILSFHEPGPFPTSKTVTAITVRSPARTCTVERLRRLPIYNGRKGLLAQAVLGSEEVVALRMDVGELKECVLWETVETVRTLVKTFPNVDQFLVMLDRHTEQSDPLRVRDNRRHWRI